MIRAIDALSQEADKLLGPLINDRKLAIFAGAGISIKSGLPAWEIMLNEFIDFCQEIFKIYGTDINNKEEIVYANDIFSEYNSNNLSKNKIDNTLNVISICKEYLNDLESDRSNIKSQIDERFKVWFISKFGMAIPNDNHINIIKTRYPIILTTNYDKLLTKAAENEKDYELVKNTFSLDSYRNVAKCLYENDPFIFNIHGNYIDVIANNIILTKQDYMDIMKKRPNLRMLLEAIFINYPILFIGYGMSDPHMEDLIEEVSFSFEYSKNSVRKFFIVVQENKINSINSKILEMKGVTLLSVKDWSESDQLLKNMANKYPRRTQ